MLLITDLKVSARLCVSKSWSRFCGMLLSTLILAYKINDGWRNPWRKNPMSWQRNIYQINDNEKTRWISADAKNVDLKKSFAQLPDLWGRILNLKNVVAIHRSFSCNNNFQWNTQIKKNKFLWSYLPGKLTNDICQCAISDTFKLILYLNRECSPWNMNWFNESLKYRHFWLSLWLLSLQGIQESAWIILILINILNSIDK